MTGSSYVPIIVPIIAFLAMALWLGMVFYADGHPGYRKSGRPAVPADEVATDAGATGQEREALPDDGGSAGPHHHERIDEHAHGALLG